MPQFPAAEHATDGDECERVHQAYAVPQAAYPGNVTQTGAMRQKTQIGLADLECISDIRVDRRLQRSTQPEIHLGAPKVSAEVAT